MKPRWSVPSLRVVPCCLQATHFIGELEVKKVTRRLYIIYYYMCKYLLHRLTLYCHNGDSFQFNLLSPSTMALRNSPLWRMKDETCPPVTHLTSEPGQAFSSSSTECFGMYPSSWTIISIRLQVMQWLKIARNPSRR